MKPSICICCGENLPPDEVRVGKNPNVCRHCEAIVETGQFPALQELVQVMTKALLHESAPQKTAAPSSSSPSLQTEAEPEAPKKIPMLEDIDNYANARRN